MSVNIDDIKKLPSEERLRIIEEIWDSIDNDIVEKELISEEELILKEREDEYKTGKLQTDSRENVMTRLRKEAEDRLNEKK